VLVVYLRGLDVEAELLNPMIRGGREGIVFVGE
jgi:hypothetical protein